jgi:hypothetical protein
MITEPPTPLVARRPKVTVVAAWLSAFVAAFAVTHLSFSPGENGNPTAEILLGGFWGIACNIGAAAFLAYFRIRKAKATFLVGVAAVLFVVFEHQSGIAVGFMPGFIINVLAISTLSVGLFLTIISACRSESV